MQIVDYYYSIAIRICYWNVQHYYFTLFLTQHSDNSKQHSEMTFSTFRFDNINIQNLVVSTFRKVTVENGFENLISNLIQVQFKLNRIFWQTSLSNIYSFYNSTLILRYKYFEIWIKSEFLNQFWIIVSHNLLNSNSISSIEARDSDTIKFQFLFNNVQIVFNNLFRTIILINLLPKSATWSSKSKFEIFLKFQIKFSECWLTKNLNVDIWFSECWDW